LKSSPKQNVVKKTGVVVTTLEDADVENLDGAEQRTLPSFSTLIGKGQRRKNSGGWQNPPRGKRQNDGFGSIPGSGRKDFPSLSSIPITDFSCLDGPGGSRDAGFYADKETKCQVAHFINYLLIPEAVFLVVLGTSKARGIITMKLVPCSFPARFQHD
jgi:hypothetical protein